MPGELSCFNSSCGYYSKADRVLVHLKDQLPRGSGAAACQKCQTAVQQALVSHEMSQPPATVCQICCGVNGIGPLQLYANGLHMLWLCSACQELQHGVLQANFFLAQKNIPTHDAQAIFTFDLPPPEAPIKRSRLEGSASPPSKRRMTRHTGSHHNSQPWELVLNNVLNQQERISTSVEQLQNLQSEQLRNMKKLHSSLPSLQDYEEVKEANETLTEEVSTLSKKLQALEEQHLSAQLTVVELRNALSSLGDLPDAEAAAHLTQKLIDILNPVHPVVVHHVAEVMDTDMIDTAPPAPVPADFNLDPMAT